MDETAKTGPSPSSEATGELASIAYLLASLETMRARNLISAEAFATVVAETRARRDELEGVGRVLKGVEPLPVIPLAEEAKAERAVEAETLEPARLAVKRGDDRRVIEVCGPWLERYPDHPEALVLLAFSLRRVGRLAEALALYRRLSLLNPQNEVWSQWVRDIEKRLPAVPQARSPEVRTVEREPEPELRPEPATDSEPVRPAFSWSSVAGEFLEEHWQKLILCLAVLLIVVSSTVGAHLLLGPRLWSPVGKCSLALVYTLMFAAFGAGLVRWGAERAGRMMLMTTLIVVPVNFMLAGEMRLLIAPSLSRLVVLGLDVTALFFVTRMVARALDWRSGATFLAVALVALSACDAATARGVSYAWGVSAFLIPPWIFLASVGWLNTRYQAESDDEHRDFAYFSLGLLTFAFLSGLLRTAAAIKPELHPCLFAVPVMLTAIAFVHTAYHQVRYEKDRRRILLMRFGGLILSALAFALALSRPPGLSALYSGNILATALLGLGLYGALLRVYRQPAYLYFAFGSLFLGYFGAFYFMVDLVHSVEEVARQALGYRQKLPFPFKALNGLGFNALLALLAVRFARRWQDERLARHCHYLGIPFAIAACVLSAFEPKAAVLCMSGYTILFTIAIPLFAAPRVVYLACSTLAGALLFGSLLVPGITLGARALGTVALGFTIWGTGRVSQRWRVPDAYRIPLVHVALVLAVAAMAAAGVSVLHPAPATITAPSTFLFAAWLCALVVADLPHVPLVFLTVVGLLGAALGGLTLASGDRAWFSPHFGVVTAALALILMTALEGVRNRTSTRARVFLAGLPDAVLILVLLAVVMAAGGGGGQSVSVAATFALGGVAWLWLTRFRREVALVYLGIGLVVASQLVLGWGRVAWPDPGIGLGALALISAASALALWRTGYVVRREGGDSFYAIPCSVMALGMTGLVFVLAFLARFVSRDAYPASAGALLANSVVLILLTATWRTPRLTYAAVVSLVSATYLTLFSIGRSDPSKAYILGLVAVIEGLGLWRIGLLTLRSGRAETIRIYARPLFMSSLLLTVLAIPTSLSSAVAMSLIAVAFLLMVKSFPAAGWLYAAFGSLVCVLNLTLLPRLSGEQRMAGAVLGVFALWGVGVVAQRVGLRVCRWLKIPALALEFPFFNAAVICGYVALCLLLMPIVAHEVPWSAHAWVPLSLSIFCLLMLKAYHYSGWIHAFAALASTGYLMAVAPLVTMPAGWLLAGTLLAVFWLVLGRDFLRVEPVLCQRLGIDEVGAGSVLERWSLFAFTIAGSLTALLVGAATFAWVYFGDVPSTLMADAGWSVVGPTLLLAWVYVVGQTPRFGENRVLGLYVVLTLFLWWLGISPILVKFVGRFTNVIPLLTAGLGLAIVLFDTRGEVGATVSARRVNLADRAAFLLGLIACAFTQGEFTATTMTLGTLLLATLTFGIQAITRHRVSSALVGGLTWCAFSSLLVFQLGRPRWISATTPWAFDLALGTTSAILALWALATWLRTTSFASKSWGVESRGRVVLALEQVALLGSFWAVASIASLTLSVSSVDLGDGEALVGVGILMVAAGFDVLVARRWYAPWLIYAAQATLLGAYFHYRFFFPVSVATDAAVLTLLGYLDLGLSEVMQRFKMNLYARPTLYVSLVLPLIPPAMAILDGRLDELSLFLLLTTAAFYGVACYTRQWKSLGYAAAVLLNAILWIAWSRVGWQLADHPQLFLIPVGLSAILFAEVNRREFGTDIVNAIRGLGLTVVYASLALPIWQFQSFGAWLTLLLLSLVGIFVGIGLRIQTFLWLGLVGFVLDVVYQVGRVSAANVLARSGVMLSLGILLFLFVALNEKKRIVSTMRQYYDRAREWE
ncbi:tetratricopeptide repeat protein [Singulisphaera sp. GP187]|uniref:tetratricopeptide repeat protein n=1 Tax=Singulisphaera sp. GP187 TaxID=1882752 RepID=UPI000940B08C|nr:bacterial transcriptional activator domain-containing protein [Singulisphaera sp. GP187]